MSVDHLRALRDGLPRLLIAGIRVDIGDRQPCPFRFAAPDAAPAAGSIERSVGELARLGEPTRSALGKCRQSHQPNVLVIADPRRWQRGQSRPKDLRGSFILTGPQLCDPTQRREASAVVEPPGRVRIVEVTQNPLRIVRGRQHRDGVAGTICVHGVQSAHRQHAHRATRIGQRVQRRFCQAEEALRGRLITSDGRRHRHSQRQFGTVVGAGLGDPRHQTDEHRLVRTQAHGGTRARHDLAREVPVTRTDRLIECFGPRLMLFEPQRRLAVQLRGQRGTIRLKPGAQRLVEQRMRAVPASALQLMGE